MNIDYFGIPQSIDANTCLIVVNNQRGACVMSYYEDHRKVILSSSKAGMDPKGIEKFYVRLIDNFGLHLFN